MQIRISTAALLSAAALLFAPIMVSADCECGYTVNATTSDSYSLYTDILESDFTTLPNITLDTDWAVQAWEVSKEASRGPYGRKTELGNVISNPVKNLNISTDGINGGMAGLELFVRSVKPDQEHVSVAEVDSRRTDMKYGSFRAGIKSTGINGTCGAFFWYLNDTQEIDMEFLSAQMNSTTSPINLVLHSTLSLDHGGDAKGTPTYKIYPLPFESDLEIHEYRFDWSPGRVSFYADGQWLTDMTEKQFVPSSPGKIVISHWSNGNPLWSGGPPEKDAIMLVSYVQAYFNSSSPARQKDFKNRCKTPSAANSICEIPNQNGAPQVGKVHFFSQDPSKNKTNNQTVYALTREKHKTSAGFSLARGSSIGSAVVVALMVGGFVAFGV